MFTGIVQDIGVITALDTAGDWQATIATRLPLENTKPGASISCSGVCLTAIVLHQQQFVVQISGETLEKTTAKNWALGTQLNLEPALRMMDELGGHLLAGHVDTVITLLDRQAAGDSWRLKFSLPEAYRRLVAPKGSAAIDGISLTVNEVGPDWFGVNIIPHTWQNTTLAERQPGDMVNFEVDLIARYVERQLAQRLVTA
jgi:riboflavin synthase